MQFVGKIRCDGNNREAFFTSEANDQEYQLIYGDATSSPNPAESAYYVVAGRSGQRVSFDGEVSDIEGAAIRIETPVRPANDPPDVDEGKGMIGRAVLV